MIEKNKSEVERSNGNLAYAILIMGCLSFIPFLVIAFVLEAYKPLALPYILEFIALNVLLLFFRKLRQHIPSTHIIYAGYATLIGYAIYTSAFVTPDYTSVIILFFLFQIPIITIDKSWRVNLIVTIYAAIYMIVAIPFKDPRLVADEILNCLLFTVFGIGLGEILRSARLENFELKRQALVREKTDYLTGLHNRKSLFEHLAQIETAAEKKSNIGILMLDIDCFKLYNDTYGHQSGDDCLKKIGACFHNFGTELNIHFYRYGGEEFVGVATGYSSQELSRICEALNKAVLDMKIPHSLNKSSFLTISIGIATTTDTSAQNWEQLALSQADIALYAAKTQGRNCTVLYVEGMTMEGTQHSCQPLC